MKHFNCTCAFFLFLAFISFIMINAGCAPKARLPVSALGTPEHHVFTGMKLLEAGKLLDAEREFGLANELDHEYSPAYTGLGLTFGYKGDFKSAFDNMCLAEKLAISKQEQALAYVGFMRLYTQQKDKDWLGEVEKNFERARDTIKDVPDMPEPYFYMGLACKEACEFDDAAYALKRVLEINKTFVDKADHELKLVQKIERAMPETPFGKKVALLEKVTRADVAALFIQELRLETIREGAFLKEIPIPVDVQDHPLRGDVKTVIGLGVQGLGVFPDGTFAPNEFVTRASYAMMIADIVCTLTDDPSLATRYRGNTSPFADVRSDVPYFNAIMVCTTRGIIEPKREMRQDIFDPRGRVSGADAVLAIRNLKEHLRIL
ncbi:MAG: S-layer homology domain-containing protein [Deltaproteobacteria bacterium]|nr:MAG: S-layer homology domain-containing protein [Deltaproteobacteria bacterium]